MHVGSQELTNVVQVGERGGSDVTLVQLIERHSPNPVSGTLSTSV